MRRFVPVLAVLAAAPAAAQETGEEIFATFCATCHGSDAAGDGPMAEILMVAPPDLTGLAAANDGVFPVSRVARQIDGRDPLLAHGGVMPLFGAFFEGDGAAIASETGQPIVTSAPIAALITYLESVQD